MTQQPAYSVEHDFSEPPAKHVRAALLDLLAAVQADPIYAGRDITTQVDGASDSDVSAYILVRAAFMSFDGFKKLIPRLNQLEDARAEQ